MRRLRIVEPSLVLLQIYDQLCRAGWQDPLERVGARVILIDPDRFDERIEWRQWNTVTVTHDDQSASPHGSHVQSSGRHAKPCSPNLARLEKPADA